MMQKGAGEPVFRACDLSEYFAPLYQSFIELSNAKCYRCG